MGSDPSRSGAAAQLAQLRLEYRNRLPAELEALRTLATSLTGEPSADHATLTDLRHRLHRLAGSGGTFGLSRLSEVTRVLELRVQGWIDHPEQQEAGSGTTLVADLAAIDITLSDAAVDDETFAVSADDALATEASQRIWLIEDDRALGQQLVAQLESFGFSVRLFDRIDDAENAANDQSIRPELLLIDIMLESEAIDATEQLDLLPGLRMIGCPLVFMSARDDFESRVRAVRLGAAGYVLKPLDVPRLVSRIGQILDQRQALPKRVLIVDDDAQLAEHYRLVLAGAGMQAQILGAPESIVSTLTTFRPELLLMDMHMPRITGPELASVVRQLDQWLSLPIVYLSAETDLDRQAEALNSGADDFLTKPISDTQLISSVRARIERARQLDDQISKDSLTGLLKHASIKEAAEIELSRARRGQTPVTLAMLDIDHFKKVNDTYGHSIGDLVISSVARLLRQRLRRSDLIGRYGGEEFAVVLPDCREETAMKLLDDIRERFSAVRFSHSGNAFSCTLSGGLACSLAFPALNSADLLTEADQALYAAKNGGRNQVRIATASPD